MERISSVTHLISSLEYLAREGDREFGGVNNWDTVRHAVGLKSRRLLKALDIVSSPRATRAIHKGRVAAAASLWLPLPRQAKAAASTALAGTQLALYPRQIFGSDGADQVSFLVQTLAAAARAGERRPRLVDACLWAVAMQSVLSYTTSGLAKLPSRTWRTGDALPGVTRTITYGDREVWGLLRRHPRANQALAHSVLALETGFPAVFLRGGRLAPPLLASVGAFHLVNARVMGLGRFFWAFSSTYPAVLYATGPRTRSAGYGQPERRSDALPLACAALAVVGVGSAHLHRMHNLRLVDRGMGDERRMTTSAGNTLAYRRTGAIAASASAPLVVLESGLGTSAAHWEWLARELGRHFPVVTYERAGYGASRAADSTAFSLEGAAADLADLAQQEAEGREIILIGHSLGGYLSLLAAARLASLVRAVVLVDASHPGELQRSSAQAQGATQLTQSVTLLPESLRAGLGPLLQPPHWLPQLPEDVRPYAQAHYRDARTWSAVQREWRATEREFRAFDGRLPKVDAAVLAVTAARTAVQLPVHAELHRELAAAAPVSEIHLLDEADHHSVLTDRHHARALAELVMTFLDRQHVVPRRPTEVSADVRTA
jgi:pimeloyl-ACP methyl ester carboxylesterase